MKLFPRPILLLSFLSLLIISATSNVFGQQKKRVIQLSGVVLEDDSLVGRPIPGVHVYVPKVGRGVTTNGWDCFSMPVLENDELTSVRWVQPAGIVVPANSKEYETIVVTMVQDQRFAGSRHHVNSYGRIFKRPCWR